MTGVVLYAISDIRNAASWDQHTTEVLAAAQNARQGMMQEVAAMRGYILSPNEDYYDDFKAGLANFDRAVERIGTLTSDNPQQQERVARLKAAGATYVAEVADPQYRFASDPSQRDRATAITANGTAAKHVAGVNDIIGDISAEEEALLAVRRAATETSFTTAYLALGLGAFLSFTVAAAMGWLLSRSVASPLVKMTAAMKEIGGGNHAVTVPAVGQADELGDMASALENFRKAGLEKVKLEGRLVSERTNAEASRREAEHAATTAARQAFIAAVQPSFERLSAGDLTARLDARANADYAELCDLFNASVSRLERTIGSVVGSIGSIHNGLFEINTASNDLAQRTEQQAASLEETVAALSEVTRAIDATAQNSIEAQSSAHSALHNAEKGGDIVRRAVEAMQIIEQSSRKIGSIISVIDEIAFQTNLLALNAGVEAARAGETGRGFAVVAQEVRGLAQRSATAAKEIKELIQVSSEQVEAGVELVGASGQSLTQIISEIGDVSRVVTEIASRTQSQAVSLREVSTAADQMDKVTQQNAAMVEQSTAAAQTLANEMDDLSGLIAEFKTATKAGSIHREARPAKRSAEGGRPSAPASAVARPVLQMKPVAQGNAALNTLTDEWTEF
ncbi:methyl-accepting chemotaxis protein [Fulvimarina endophytica]|nr:methyl-accepting chemotaxis protein [Fulvimarina endophytica]